jgi:hypothetical protein
MKSKKERIEELLGKELPKEFILPIGEAMEQLNVPDEFINRMLGLNALEAKMAGLTMALLMSKELNQPEMTKRLSEEIGALVAEQLAKGNYDAPRAISEGLTLLQQGKEFKKTKQRRRSIKDQTLVLVAYYLLEKVGFRNPSQTDVLSALDVMGFRMGKERVSRIFDTLKLKKVARDARLAVNRRPDKLPMRSD